LLKKNFKELICGGKGGKGEIEGVERVTYWFISYERGDGSEKLWLVDCEGIMKTEIWNPQKKDPVAIGRRGGKGQ